VWLYEPPILLASHARVRLGAVRPDAGWLGIPGWSIAPLERLPRDAAPARTP
jgi:hypothetical protein